METIPISAQGLVLLKTELEKLKQERPAVIQAIRDILAEGDFSENAALTAARERQGMLETRIAAIESRLPYFSIVDPSSMVPDRIAYGATVTLEDTETGETKEYIVLGPDETDYVKDGISVFSPVGRALLGREEGDEISVEVPRGRLSYEVVSIKYRDPDSYFPKPE